MDINCLFPNDFGQILNENKDETCIQTFLRCWRQIFVAWDRGELPHWHGNEPQLWPSGGIAVLPPSHAVYASPEHRNACPLGVRGRWRTLWTPPARPLQHGWRAGGVPRRTLPQKPPGNAAHLLPAKENSEKKSVVTCIEFKI